MIIEPTTPKLMGSPRGARRKRIEDLLRIFDALREEGDLPVNVRSVYYRLISSPMFHGGHWHSRKNIDSYISDEVSDMRLKGMLPFDYISEEGKTFYDFKGEHASPEDLLSSSPIRVPRLDWCARSSQPYRLEVFYEKRAHASNDKLLRTAMKYCLPVTSAGGVPSTTQAYSLALRVAESQLPTVVLWLGDCDVAGWSMPRGFIGKVRTILEHQDIDHDIILDRVTLNPDQTHGLQPAPSPDEKYTKKKLADYTEQTGLHEGYEIDALRIDTINELLEAAILRYYDADVFEEQQELQGRINARLDDLRKSPEYKSHTIYWQETFKQIIHEEMTR